MPTPPSVLRPITDPDVPEVLRLNHENVDLLAPLDADRLDQLRGWAARADVVTADHQVAGFVLVFAPGTAYDSENYGWFTQHYGADFLYLDRIVLDDRFRRRGLGTAVYDEVEASAAAHGRLVLEVNVEPPNEPSLAFHRARGYTEVGTRGPAGHRVVLMAKELSAERRSAPPV